MVAQSRAKLLIGNQCSIDERLISFTMTTIYILFYNGTEGSFKNLWTSLEKKNLVSNYI